MTPEELMAHGYHEFTWNNGLIMEYWKSLYSDDDFDYRLGVRFGEYRDIPFIVWLFGRSSMIRVNNAKTIADVETVYRLFKK